MDASSDRTWFTRQRLGLPAAGIAVLIVAIAELPSLSPQAHRLAAVLAAVVVLWITEALPLATTALLGLIACIVLQIAPAATVFAPFADPLVFLLIGSFLMVKALFHQGLDQRIATALLSPKRGVSSRTLICLYAAAAAVISSWVSNAATTAMMYAIGLAIIAEMERHFSGEKLRIFAANLMLMASYAATVGGMATPVGTPPNMMGLVFIRRYAGVDFTFLQWIVTAFPLVVMLFAFICWQLRGPKLRIAPDVVSTTPLGSLTRGHRLVAAAWVVTITLWVAPGAFTLAGLDTLPAVAAFKASFPEAIAPFVGIVSLLLARDEKGEPALPMARALEIDWAIVLLYAAGFAFGVLAFETGLAKAVGVGLTTHLPSTSPLALLALAVFFAVALSEATSNTAAANMVVPITIGIAQTAGVDPLPPAIGATFASSLGFMLPVSTPGNAIVYGSRRVPLSTMMAKGIALDIVGAIIIIASIHSLLPLVR